nr:MAG TPA: hypothetical protein [Caudoviricetes sp.]
MGFTAVFIFDISLGRNPGFIYTPFQCSSADE